MKHRAGSSTIKYQHSMIQDLRRFLEEHLEPLKYEEAIIPGAIKRARGATPALHVRFQYVTHTGAKLMAQHGGAVQEVFIVTKEPEPLRKFLEAHDSKTNVGHETRKRP